MTTLVFVRRFLTDYVRNPVNLLLARQQVHRERHPVHFGEQRDQESPEPAHRPPVP